MIKSLAAIALSLIVPAAVLAEAPAAAPATQPAAAGEAKVLIVPFVPVETTDPDWIGRAVQQSLLADLSRTSTGVSIQPVSDTTKITSVQEALDAGKKADVRYVIFGSYLRIEPTLRITGQIVDVSTGKVIAGLKSTGSDRDLFDMQDNLGFQAKWGLGTERLAEKTAAAKAAEPQVAAAPPMIQPQGPVVRAGERYADSDLGRAVADGRSLIDREDAAGEGFRREYYNEGTPAYPAGYGGWYGWNGFYGGYPYGYWWWGWGGWGRTTVIINSNDNCNTNLPSRQPFQSSGGAVRTVGSRDYSIGRANTMGSYPMTMQSTQRNYIANPNGNYIRPQRSNVAPAPAPVSGPARQPFSGGTVRTTRVK